jgi:hypothetical protein
MGCRLIKEEKVMSRQLEEGNPYSSNKSKKLACARTITVTVLYGSWTVDTAGCGGRGKSRVCCAPWTMDDFPFVPNLN